MGRRDYPLRRPSGAHQPSHFVVIGDDGLCVLCGRGASSYVHMMFTPKTMSDDEYVTFKTRENHTVGMFTTYENFEDAFKVGDTFTLEGAKLGAILNTVHGQNQQVLFKINGEVYSAFGAGFIGQAQRAEPGDFPTEVEFVTQPPKQAGHNPTKLLWPVGHPKPWESADAPGKPASF